jgi:histidine triad (HIT) family protein
MSEDCIFCKIVRKDAPSSVVFENKQVLAFMDIRPVYEGHTLVIPKLHYVDVFDTPDDVLANIHIVAKQISVAVKRVSHADGISIVQQNGKAAGQDIFHMHVHVIPRFHEKKMPHFPELASVSREELDKVAEKVRKEL